MLFITVYIYDSLVERFLICQHSICFAGLKLLCETNLLQGFNKFTGTIPTELGRLKHLVSVEYSANGLTGSIPTELGSVSTLQRIGFGKHI